MQTTHAADLANLPKLGQPWPGVEASAFAGVCTSKDGQPYALVLLPNKSPERLTWSDGMAWAAALDADLPSRVDGATLFANIPEAFEKTWHWTNEQYAGNESYAWSQHFGYGNQDLNDKSYAGRVRAVRRFPIGTSILSDATNTNTSSLVR